jgi:hypothetical protein
MAFYTFASANEFQTWHKAIKDKLNYPLDEVTNEYTSGIVVAENDVRAYVLDEDAEGLILSEEPPRLTFGDELYEVIF